MTPEDRERFIADLERQVAALNRQNESLRTSLRAARAQGSQPAEPSLSTILRQATEKIVAATAERVVSAAAPAAPRMRIVAVDGDVVASDLTENTVCGYRAIVHVDDEVSGIGICLLGPGHNAPLPGYAEHVLSVSSAARQGVI